ncbi:four helix bundle protein [Aliifodinibius sp. 1BSP15-2V2]|uniref:Four helix bundle protein n=1 Tax=Fodinibius salsisoli TaxID=2820877 RepID=A0ABT3PLP8_9BACT|nr:four helix bundle protein [Fodinibius salsisoli]
MIQLSHKNMDVWKSAIELSADIYKLTDSFPKHELYGPTSQLR